MKDFTVIPLYTSNRVVLFKMTDCVAPLLKTPQQLTSFKEEKPISYRGLQDPARSGPYYHSSLWSIILQPHWPPLCSSNMVSTFLLSGLCACFPLVWDALPTTNLHSLPLSLHHLIRSSLTLPNIRLNSITLMSSYQAVPHKLNIILRLKRKKI